MIRMRPSTRQSLLRLGLAVIGLIALFSLLRPGDNYVDGYEIYGYANRMSPG